MLYSLGNFQLVLSAYDFLLECDPDKTYSKIELRRFRFFEITMVVEHRPVWSSPFLGRYWFQAFTVFGFVHSMLRWSPRDGQVRSEA